MLARGPYQDHDTSGQGTRLTGMGLLRDRIVQDQVASVVYVVFADLQTGEVDQGFQAADGCSWRLAGRRALLCKPQR